jgi:hypothetical protein
MPNANAGPRFHPLANEPQFRFIVDEWSSVRQQLNTDIREAKALARNMDLSGERLASLRNFIRAIQEESIRNDLRAFQTLNAAYGFSRVFGLTFATVAARFLGAFVTFLPIEQVMQRLQELETLYAPRTATQATMTDAEIEAMGSASLSFSTVDISQNTTGLDESLGFNTDTGQHTVSTPSLSAPHGVLGNFNFETGMYNNFGPGTSGPTGAASGSTTSGGTGRGGSPGTEGTDAP